MTATTQNRHREIGSYTCRVAILAEAPGRVLIFPWGKVNRWDYEQSYLIDDLAGADVVAAFKARKIDLPFDYEHQTEGGKYASPTGRAPAAGWIKSLAAVPGDGIYAEVEWTREAARMISEKEYRYVSPSFLYYKDDLRICEITSVALTNNPAIVGMRPMVATMGDGMDEKFVNARYFLNLETTATEEQIMQGMEEYVSQLRQKLGVPATATAEQVMTALTEKLAAGAKAASLRTAVCKELGVAETAGDEELVTAANKAKAPAEPDPARFAPIAVVTAMRTELDQVKGELLAGKCDAFVADGMKAGRIVEANRAMWERVFRADPVQAAKDLESSPVIAPAAGRVVNRAPAGAAGGTGERAAVIQAARAEFDGHREELAKITNRRNYINGELRTNSLPPLTDDEVKTVAA